MIIKEFYITRSDGVNLYRIYSDEEHMLLQVETGAIYEEAIDIEDAPYTYKEISEPFEIDSKDESIDSDEISAEEFLALVEEAL